MSVLRDTNRPTAAQSETPKACSSRYLGRGLEARHGAEGADQDAGHEKHVERIPPPTAPNSQALDVYFAPELCAQEGRTML